ncbi:MAG: hypothetical protein IPP74_06575 [Alphaproteobacteria bacterium]|nr:hypothetical protein [Alphaproteobacteria bacterium]
MTHNDTQTPAPSLNTFTRKLGWTWIVLLLLLGGTVLLAAGYYVFKSQHLAPTATNLNVSFKSSPPSQTNPAMSQQSNGSPSMTPSTSALAHIKPQSDQPQLPQQAPAPSAIPAADHDVIKLLDISHELRQALFTCHDFDVITHDISEFIDSRRPLPEAINQNLRQVLTTINSQTLRCYPDATQGFQRMLPHLISIYWQHQKPTSFIDRLRKWAAPFMTIRSIQPDNQSAFEHSISLTEKSLTQFDESHAIFLLETMDNDAHLKPAISAYLSELRGLQLLVSAVNTMDQTITLNLPAITEHKEKP